MKRKRELDAKVKVRAMAPCMLRATLSTCTERQESLPAGLDARSPLLEFRSDDGRVGGVPFVVLCGLVVVAVVVSSLNVWIAGARGDDSTT